MVSWKIILTIRGRSRRLEDIRIGCFNKDNQNLINGQFNRRRLKLDFKPKTMINKYDS